MNLDEQKVIKFYTALTNVYLDEEEREGFQKIDYTDDQTEDFTAILQALYVHYIKTTGEDSDLVGFTHILNRLAIQAAGKANE